MPINYMGLIYDVSKEDFDVIKKSWDDITHHNPAYQDISIRYNHKRQAMGLFLQNGGLVLNPIDLND